MRVAILGLGVIGTTYAYAFQKAGHETFHIIREGRKDIPSVISVQLLDGRYNAKGEEKQDKYKVSIAENNEEYDFIIVSVASGKLDAAIRTIKVRRQAPSRPSVAAERRMERKCPGPRFLSSKTA